MTTRKVEIVVTADDTVAKADLRELKLLKDSLKDPVTIKVKLDAPSGFKLDKFAATMRELGKMTAKPSVEVRGLTAAIAGVRILRDELRKLDGTRASVDTGGARGGGGGGGGFWSNTLRSFGGNFGNWFSNLSSLQKTGAIAGGTPVAAGLGISALGIISGLLEALIPTLIGGGVGAIGVAGAQSLDPKAFAGVTKALDEQFRAALQAGSGFSPASSRASRLAFLPTGQDSFLTGVLEILKQIRQFVGTLGPELSLMFKASLPFIQMFVRVGEEAAKIMLPAFTQSMRLMTPFLPIIAKGLLNIVQGFAGFLKALGPQGMQSGARIFADVTKVIEGILIGLGHTIDFLSQLTVDMWHAWRVSWDLITHYFDTAVLAIRHGFDVFISTADKQFTQLGKDLVNIWESFWNNVVGRTIRGGQDVGTTMRNWGHEIANLWDGMRHEVAHIWDMMWNDTIGAAIRGIANVQSKIRGLVSGIVGEIKKLPGQLLSLGKQALSDLWNGMKSMAPNILNWAKSFIGGLGSNPFGLIGIFAKALHLGSPSRVMYEIGRNTMLGLENGMKSRIPHVRGLTGHIGGGVVSWIQAAMKAAHAPQSWLPALERLVQLESGGNPQIVNSTPVGGQHASGLWQMLPSTYAAYAWGLPAGDLFNPIVEGISALRYIMANYGSPFNIPGLMSGNYHGYWGGGWVNEPVFGLGMKSGHTYGFAEHGSEYVSHSASGGGNTYIFALDESYSDEQALRLIKKVRRYKERHGRVALGIA